MKRIPLFRESNRVDLSEQLAHDTMLRRKVLRYLSGAQVVLSARGVVPDRFSDEAAPIPILFHCDGEFIWSGEFAAYVERYDWPIPADLLDRVIQHGGEPPSLDDSEATAALSQIRQTGR